MAMLFRRIHRTVALGLLLGYGLTLGLAAQNSPRRGRKYKVPPPTSRVEITILRADDEKPIENAAVIFTMVGDKGNMELKTNEDGKAVLDVLPIGSKVLLQVLAKGYQTYGQDYTLDKSQMAMEVKLKRPGKQYSIYQKHPEAAKQSGEGNDKPAGKDDKDAPKADQPSESANQPDTKPDASQPQPQ